MFMTVVLLRIDLAKNVFALHRVDQAGRAVLVRHDQLLQAFPVKSEPARQLTPTPPCPA